MHRWSKYTLTTENIGIYEEIYENVRIIDCHAHIGHDKDSFRMPTATLVRKFKESNIDHALCFALDEPGPKHDFHKANDVVREAAKKYPEVITPFFRLDPNYPWKKEFDQRMEEGFKGLKLHPRSQNFKIGSAKAMKVYAACADVGIPILIHAGMGLENIADDIGKMVHKNRKLKVILGHAAFVDLDNTIKKVGKNERVLFDTSSLRLFDLYDLIKKLDYRRIAFGSDIPYYDVDWALQGVIDTAICLKKSAGQIKKIMGGNVAKWFP